MVQALSARLGAAAIILGIVLLSPERARAVSMDPNPPPPPPSAQPASKAKPATGTFKSKKKKKPTKKEEQSERTFHDGYRTAHTLIYQRGDYQGGIAALHAIGQDEHPDIANLIGYASRKLGRYDDARHWYEKALAADPRHARTLSYYGMWHAEQGNRLKAEEFLDSVRSICGTGCREYTELKGVIEGTATY